MPVLKVEIFDSASRLVSFVNDKKHAGKIKIQQIISRSIADVGSVYDLFYWETKPWRKKSSKK